MIDRTTKLRWRRRVRKGRRQVETIGEQAEQQLEQHVIKRLSRVWLVRRFLLTWLCLIVLLMATLVGQLRGLSQYYQTPQPIPGGTYTEGVLGAFTNANPLYATGPVDSAVSRLVFSGLFKYSQNNTLIGDLARNWQVNERGNVYTVRLRDDIRWQDGKPVTALDVAFTYSVIQNPDAKSPLFSSWQGVKIEVINGRTIQFTLPQALNAFPYAMTNGIVPRHLLDGIPPSHLRSVAFNTRPVGAGPFVWKTLEVIGNTPEDREERIALTANPNYVGGAPKLDRFVLRVFRNEKALTASFDRQELTAMAGLNKLPDGIARQRDVTQVYNFPLTSATMVFYRNTNEILADPRIRRALTQAADTTAILKHVGYPVQAVKEPLLQSQIGYDPTLAQFGNSLPVAQQLLDQAGWVLGPDGMRSKDGNPLTFRLFTEDTPEYTTVAEQLKQQWHAVGASVEILPQSAGDLQGLISQHTYDILLYGISLGADPDVFAYWHSSQSDIRSSRFNFSDYRSPVADRALEAGRSRSDAAIRAIKYRPFLEAWRNDVPAMGLYQPRFLYVTRRSVAGLKEHPINTSVDRYSNVENWMVRETNVDNP